MSVLNNAAPPASDSAPAPNDALDEPPGFAEIRILMLEVLRLAHASDALEAHFPIPFTSTQPANLTSQSHTQQPLAS